MQRSQMTFFVSFWEAINSLPKKDQLPLFRATIAYGLFGSHSENLSSTQSALFSLIQPVLDKSRKKASNRKQNENKMESNEEETDNENEKEKEKDKERDKEKEYEKEYEKQQTEIKPSFSGKHFSVFWDAYPRKIDRESAWKAWKSISPDVKTAPQIISALEDWKKSSRWQGNDGQYIPSAANFLLKGYWKAVPAAGKKAPCGASGELGEAELEALRKTLAMDPDELLRCGKE